VAKPVCRQKRSAPDLRTVIRRLGAGERRRSAFRSRRRRLRATRRSEWARSVSCDDRGAFARKVSTTEVWTELARQIVVLGAGRASPRPARPTWSSAASPRGPSSGGALALTPG